MTPLGRDLHSHAIAGPRIFTAADASLAVGAMVLIYPALMLVVHGAMNTAFAILLIMSVALIVQAAANTRSASGGIPREAWVYALSMAALPASIALSLGTHQLWSWLVFDAPSRFLLAVPIYWAASALPARRLRALQYGVVLGALIAAASTLLNPVSWGGRHLGTSFLDPIHFGDLALLLGVLSAFSMDWGGRDNLPLRTVKLLALCAGAYASGRSESRGGWVALPFLALLWFGVHQRKLTRAHKVWAWQGGSSTDNASGSYGTQGSLASVNTPGTRYDAVSWTDAAGNLWLFGGNGFDAKAIAAI